MKKQYTLFLCVILFLSLLTINISAQTDQDPQLEKANNLLQEKKYSGAVEIFEKYLAEHPENRVVWYRLGSAYHSMGKYQEAIKAYEHIADANNPFVLYNLACACSRAGQIDNALSWLKKAVENGFKQTQTLKTDPDLDAIRSTDKFTEIFNMIKTCDNTPEFHQFDFWVGEWDVYNTQNQKVGDSKIEKILKNCIILENWYGAAGGEGKSFNHYEADKKKWFQYWIDQNSSVTNYEGEYDPAQKAIVFYSYDHAKDTKPYIGRLTFFDLDENTVRQFSQRSTDGGKTWSVVYDFTYRRKQHS